ncbi:hypothetical protein TWF192_007769 [Orbilia oligospora]|uniref:Uncharacterized protein n=1 Tax=Orbilia oligospora TaxID=2813651 RepID=A0A6G1M3R3_ORBOL|nr:hypothetical protein TWF679_007241 [Orbilia oligospora]KAF3227808.1 hypothetical protein TWF191_003330 [Orbilia oligospora]KAF3244475.1 hypothetical protein TWF192_007769 [Orbilia oligospora]
MKVSMILVSALSSIALYNPVSGTPLPGVADLAPESVSSPMFWIGTPIPGGPEVRLNGTAQEIVEQIKEINPNWEEAPAPTATTGESPTNVKRYFQNRPTCGLVVGDWAVVPYLRDPVISYLYALGATTCGAYARTCSRVSCHWSAAVELCNDRTTEVQMRCDRIAHAANEITNDCAKPAPVHWVAKGQWFDTTGYNVVVRKSNC